MIEKYLVPEDPCTLDLRSLTIDSPELKEIYLELESNFSITNLIADFGADLDRNSADEDFDFNKYPFKEILIFISRNQTRAAIERIAKNDPDYYIFDFSYSIEQQNVCKKLTSPYLLTTEEFNQLIQALKKNTHVKILVLNNLKDKVTVMQFLRLADVLKEHKTILAWYCLDNGLGEDEFRVIKQKFAKHPSLVQLTLSSEQQIFYPNNFEKQTKAIARCNTLSKIIDCLQEIKYIPDERRIIPSIEIINKINAWKVENITSRFDIKKKVVAAITNVMEQCRSLEEFFYLIVNKDQIVDGEVYTRNDILKAVNNKKLEGIPEIFGMREKVSKILALQQKESETNPTSSTQSILKELLGKLQAALDKNQRIFVSLTDEASVSELIKACTSFQDLKELFQNKEGVIKSASGSLNSKAIIKHLNAVEKKEASLLIIPRWCGLRKKVGGLIKVQQLAKPEKRPVNQLTKVEDEIVDFVEGEEAIKMQKTHL